MSVPVYSPVTELLSLLHDPIVMAKENLIPGYDVLTGKSAAGEFWDPTTLSNDNLNTIPVPNNPHWAVGEIDCCTTFQEAVKRFYSKDHHMCTMMKHTLTAMVH